MASPETLEIESLVRPISDDQPGGIELRSSSEGRAWYGQVKEAREAARSIERRLAIPHDPDGMDEDRVSEQPDWGRVRELATKVLTEYSKDLWVCAWLIEAQLRLYGFAGLRDALRVTHQIVANNWNHIHPEPDEDGYATTIAQIVGLNGEDAEGALIAPIDRVPIVPVTNVLSSLSSADYRDAVEFSKINDSRLRNEKIERGAITLEAFERAVREAPAQYFQDLLDDLDAAAQEYRQLVELLENNLGGDVPSSSIRTALSEVRQRVASLAKSHLSTGETEEAGANELVTGASDASAVIGATVNTNAAAYNRDDAFRALLKVADFFHRTEPHSPVSYALEQAVRWGRMSLPDLMRDLIGDDSVRREMFKRLGIEDSDHSSD